MIKSLNRSLLYVFISSAVMGCIENSAPLQQSQGEITLESGEAKIGNISNIGDVDWYKYTTTQENEVVSFNVRSNVLRSDVELLATVYQLDQDGNKIALYGDHAIENSVTNANLDLNLKIKQPRDIFLSVRDFKDDAADGFEYKVSVNSTQEEDNSSSFSDALSINASCQVEHINSIGDSDVFSFSLNEASIYQITTHFEKQESSPVQLLVKLYNQEGELIELVSKPTGQGKIYPMVHHLLAGTYYLTVEDSGRNNFDLYSPFTICAQPVESNEMGKNDNMETAQGVSVGQSATQISGSLDYNQDQDWYKFTAVAGQSGDFQVLQFDFDSSEADAFYQYDISIISENGNVLMSHTQNSASQEYSNQIAIEAGENYYVSIKPVDNQVYASTSDNPDIYTTKASYIASLSTVDVDDSQENGQANNSQQDATPLASGADWTHGKIAYRTDNDWYKIVVPSQQHQVLEVFLETENTIDGGAVEYSLAIVSDQVVRTVEDLVGSDGPTQLKTSILIPPNDASADTTYFFRVRDFQDDDSNATEGYRIKARYFDIPNNFLTNSNQPTGAVYFDEKTEQLNASRDNKITLEAEATLFDRVYSADLSMLKFDGDEKNTDIQASNTDGKTSFVTPWIGGYIDYQGDQDWLKFNLKSLLPTPLVNEMGAVSLDDDGNIIYSEPDSEWYYDIKVELLSAGSNTEYIWKMHYDRTDNQIVNDYSSNSGDGVIASNGDTSKNKEALSLSNGGDNSIWRNHKLSGAYYLKISDLNITDNNKVYEQFDDYDWGYDEPYYVRLTLTYHAGLARKED